MKPFLFMLGLFAILFGCLLLLPLLAWASLQPPQLEGTTYVMAVVAKLFHDRAAWATLAGVGAIVLGIAGVLHTVFPVRGDRSGREHPAFWGTLAITSLGVLLLLIGVNYLRAG